MSVKKSDLMSHVKNLENMAKSQLFHTSGDSSVSNWAGSDHSDQDEWSNGIDDAGTDYNGVKKALADKVRKSQALTPAEVAIAEGRDPRPAIANKVSKGQSLTPAELWAVKGGLAQMMGKDDMEDTMKSDEVCGKPMKPGEQDSASSAPDTHAGNKEDDETEGDAKKSFNAALNKSGAGRQGVEVSPFLAALAQAFAAGIEGAETKIAKSIESLAGKLDAMEGRINGVEQNFGKSLQLSQASTETLVALGEAIAHQGEQGVVTKSLPVSAPKSLTKSEPVMGGSPLDSLHKSQIIDVMCDMVQKSLLQSTAVIKFESTGELTPDVGQKVSAYLGSGGR